MAASAGPPERDDAALVREMLPLQSAFGCNVWVSAVLISALFAGLFGLRAGLIILGIGAGSAVLLIRWRERTPKLLRARVAARELALRFGARPLAERLPAARAELASTPGLKALLLFRAVALPHGGLEFVRIELGPEPRIALRASPQLADLQRGEASTLELRRRDLPLTAAHVTRLRALLTELDPAVLAAIPTTTLRDGLRCEAVVLQRSAAELYASANLAGLTEAQRAHPGIRLLQLLLDLDLELS